MLSHFCLVVFGTVWHHHNVYLHVCVCLCANDKRKESDSKKKTEEKVGAETFQFLIDLVFFAFDV